MEKGLRFSICDSYNFIYLLRRLKEAEFLKKEIIKEVIEFKNENDESFEWNSRIFENYLNSYKMYSNENFKKDKNIGCNEYLQLINFYLKEN